MAAVSTSQKGMPELTGELIEREVNRNFTYWNRFIGYLLIANWLAVVIIAYFFFGKTWHGAESLPHPHLTSAICLGFLVGGVPGLLGVLIPEKRWIAYCLAAGQMLLIGLLTHVSDGHIEMHFGYFGSLAMLTCYREWRIIVVASAVAAVDHLLRGLFLPFSIFGTDQVQIWRVVEHAAWVIWEDLFLIPSLVQSKRQMRSIAELAGQQQLAAEASAAQVKEIIEAAESLRAMSKELNANASELSQQANGSLDQARNVAAQMTQMAEQASQMNSSAKDIASRSAESSQRLAESDAAATHAVAEIGGLVESSQQITDVLDTIQTLVFQTNLLSVNASIEAAHAGKAGASFAVVADEVRYLAEESRKSSENINQRISTVQSKVGIVGSRLTEICDSVSQISTLSSAINQSAQTQASVAASVTQATSSAEQASREMLQSMAHVYQLSETASDAAGRAAELAERLHQLAHA